MRTCDFAPRTEDPIKTPIKTKLFKIFENKLQKWIYIICILFCRTRVCIYNLCLKSPSSGEYLLINLSEPFFDTTVGPRPNLALTKNKIDNPRGVIYWCLWHVCGWVAWFKPVVDRKLLERLMSPKSQVMFASAFSWISDFCRIFGIHIFQVMASLVNLV